MKFNIAAGIFLAGLAACDAKIGAHSSGGACHQLASQSKWSEAVSICKKEVAEGNRTSMFHLGYMYRNGYGVDQNLDRTVDLYERSAQLGSSLAMYNLGVLYKEGIGVEKSAEKYIEFIEAAAQQKNPRALKEMAVIHLNSEPLEKNDSLAMKYFKEAAEMGDASSAYNYGLFLMQGLLGEPDPSGIIWVSAAVKLGVAPEGFTMEEVLRSLTAEQVAEVEKKSEDLKALMLQNRKVASVKLI